MSKVLFLCGPPGSGKTQRVLAEYVHHAASHGDDGVALIVSTGRAAAAAMESLAGSEARRGLFDPRIFTFPSLAETLLDANHRPVRRISGAQRRLLWSDAVRRLAAEGKLPYLQHVADLAGFVDAVSEVVEELKRAAVDPPTFASQAQAHLPDHPANDDIAALYGLYQSMLLERGLYDDAGAFWEARDLLRDGKLRPLDNVGLLLVDGFSEFTATQLQMLQLLTPRIERTIVTLCMAPDRQDSLFVQARQTLEQLSGSLAGGAQQWLHTPPPRNALDEVRGRLFTEHPKPSLVDDGTIRLLGAPGLRGEVREIGRRVKALVLDGTRPGRIAILLRSLDGYEVAIDEAFSEYGIPVELSRGQLLSRCPAVQAVLDLLDITSGDWQRDDVVKLVGSNYMDLSALGIDNPATVDDFEAVALAARIIGGRANWVPQLGVLRHRLLGQRERALAGEIEDEDEGPQRRVDAIDRDLRCVDECERVLGRLAAVLDPIAAAKTLTAGVRAFSAAIDQLGIIRRTTASAAPPAIAASDLAALTCLCDALREAAEAPEMLGIEDTPGPAGLAGYVRDVCSRERVPGDRDSGAGVRVLDVTEARELSFDHVFIAGLSEGAFPRGRRQDPIYHDDDRQRLNAESPLLQERLPQQDHERYLFYLALSRARETVTLSHPTSDANGAPVLGSYYVDEVLRHYARPPEAHTVSLSQTSPGADEACGPRELVDAAVSRRPGERPDEDSLQAARIVAPKLVEHVHYGAAVAHERDSFAPQGRYDGVITDAAAVAVLRTDFGAGHHFSAGQFGAYGQCPLSFFLERVLRLEALEVPTEEISALDLGTVMHRILSRFFQARCAGLKGRPLTGSQLDSEKLRLIDLTGEAFREFRRSLGVSVHRKLWQLTAAATRDDLLSLLEFEAQDNESGKYGPRAVWGCELPYGKAADFDIGEEDPILVEGRIDRVDIIPGSEPLQFVVLDYKIGAGRSRQEVLRGRDFQLPLYCLAAEACAFSEETVEAGWWAYYRVRRPVGMVGRVRAQDKEEVCLQTMVDAAIEHMRRYARQIRDGHFPLPTVRCAAGYCPYKSICRYDAHRVARKAAASGGVPR